MLGDVAKANNGPVVVYDENGKISQIIGEKLPGEALHMQHVKNKNGGGHWIDPRDPNGTPSSGPTNCMVDAATSQINPEAKAKLGIKDGADLRKHVVQHMRKQPALTRELIKTTTEIRWRNADVLMTGGSVMSKTADGLLVAQKWLDEHPSVRMILIIWVQQQVLLCGSRTLRL
jgi:hypothetical protein